jgi:hypothetical protein
VLLRLARRRGAGGLVRVVLALLARCKPARPSLPPKAKAASMDTVDLYIYIYISLSLLSLYIHICIVAFHGPTRTFLKVCGKYIYQGK